MVAASPSDYRPNAHVSGTWMLIGESSGNTLIVRGGKKPVCIRVSHSDSEDLFQLLTDANEGICSRNKISGDRVA